MILYMILSAEKAGELSAAVNKAISEGWTPLGGLVVHGEPHALKPWYFAQAMTRDEAAP